MLEQGRLDDGEWRVSEGQRQLLDADEHSVPLAAVFRDGGNLWRSIDGQQAARLWGEY